MGRSAARWRSRSSTRFPSSSCSRSTSPDLTVCTHFLPAEIISWLTEKGKLKRTRAGDRRHRLRRPRPVDLLELRPLLRRARRDARPPGGAGNPGAADHGLGHPDRPRVRGAEGPDGAPREVRAAARWRRDPDLGGRLRRGQDRDLSSRRSLRLRHPAQVVAICGHNEELKARLDHLAAGLAPRSRVALKVVGYTTAMDEYMAAADLVVGKPGGLTTSEALAAGWSSWW